ncbi:sensor histidine kinase [Ferirhizobium litorale]|uniref:histidine kinase n=1 Tax=Ferirhizobium litorale TaxID=2927786 RepID=A0AAE3QKH0_9HYPH|nr:ATP-binding protein [Fererhizobium litorale]MDI7924738.1 ATP-binding protein [Fererhizobium litorale]
MVAGAGAFLRGQGSLQHDLVIGLIALILLLTVFYVDAFTKIEGAIAVLYVIALLLLSEVVTRRALMAMAILCAALAIFAFLFSHGIDPGIQPTLRLTVSLAALAITTALLLRNDTFRSELLASNAALRESEGRYRSIFDNTKVALWEHDYSRVRSHLMELKLQGVTDLRVHVRSNPGAATQCMDMISTVAANEAAYELLGPHAGDGGPGTLRRYVASDDETFIDLMQAILDGAEHFEGKGTVTTDGGEKRLVLLSIGLPDDASTFNRVVVGMIDITQREMTQKALNEAQAELTRAARAATVGALSASLAHELNQPLGAIGVNAQTLLRWLDRDPPDLAAVRKSAERIIRDGQRASDIIQNTRSMLTQNTNESEWIDLYALIDETTRLMEHDLQRDAVVVDIHRNTRIPSVKTVRIELQQVLINLMTNAVQAMSSVDAAPRTIVIDVAPRTDEIVSIVVRDNGPGIAADARDKVFAPFYTTKASGMGMGLSICRSTLEARGGKLEGYNHPEGGAVFEITLPLEDLHE